MSETAEAQRVTRLEARVAQLEDDARAAFARDASMRESFARLETTVKLAGAFLGGVSLIVSPIVTAALLRLVGA